MESALRRLHFAKNPDTTCLHAAKLELGPVCRHVSSQLKNHLYLVQKISSQLIVVATPCVLLGLRLSVRYWNPHQPSGLRRQLNVLYKIVPPSPAAGFGTCAARLA